MQRHSRSSNYRVLRNILSKTRHMDMSWDMSYLVVYTFLYKYCSDMLKDYFLTVIEEEAITLDEAFKRPEYQDRFRKDALDIFGYHIPSPDLFLDELINQKYENDFFIHELMLFSKEVEFAPDSNHEKYFNFIFQCIKSEINFNKYEFEGENHLIIKDLVYTISKLDILEEDFPFEKVFDRVCEARFIQVDKNPEYIDSILAAIVASQKNYLDDVYVPFLNDASSVINLADYYNDDMTRIYGRGFDKITYCASIVKLLVHYFNLNGIFLEFASPFESMNIEGVEFDAIISKIPLITPKRVKRLNKAQNEEIAKRNKMKKLENVLQDTFNLPSDSLNDNELKNTIEALASKIDLENEISFGFSEEYSSLRNSEYLFLINLINSLRKTGIMVVSLPQSFLSKNSLEILRKYLTFEKNYIDCVISIPEELSRARISEIIVIFKKNKSNDDIVFIDLTREYSTKTSPYIAPGLFKRNLLLDNKTLSKVIDVYNKRKVIDKFSNVVRISEIQRNEFNLSISRYVDTFEGEFINLEDLKDQKHQITSKIKELNEKIDMMMDELDLRL